MIMKGKAVSVDTVMEFLCDLQKNLNPMIPCLWLVELTNPYVHQQ